MTVDRQGTGPGDCGGNAAPYVLGALTDAEHEAFVAHLHVCVVCREEVAALEPVAAALPAAAAPVSAPPEIKRRIMGVVHQDARRADSSRSSGAHRTRSLPRWRPVLAALAVGVTAIVLLAIALAGGSGSGSRVIRAQVNTPGARATVRLSDGHAQLTLARMPKTQPGRVYEVWVVRSGAPAPTDALFTVTSNGAATVGIPGSITGVKEVLVTSEPVGGSRVPTTSPVIIAKLA